MKKNILLRGIMVGALAVATAGFAGCHANIGPPSLDWEVQQMGGHGEGHGEEGHGEEGHGEEGHEAEGHGEELHEEELHEEVLEEIEEAVLEEEIAEAVGSAITVDHVNFRTEADHDADIMETITTGVEVEVLSTEGEWAHISYNGKTGYVSVEYLEFTEE